MARAAAARQKVHRLPLTEARVHLGSVIRRVRVDKSYVILEKDGFPVAGLMDIDEFEDYLDLRDPKIRRAIAASETERKAGKTRAAAALLAELGGAVLPVARQARPGRKSAIR